MQFVVATLSRNLGLSKEAAIRAMLEVHTKGGALLPLSSESAALQAAAAVQRDAQANRHSLVCRAVSQGQPGGIAVSGTSPNAA